MSFSLAPGMIGMNVYNSILNDEQHGASQQLRNGRYFIIFIENVRIPFADHVSAIMDNEFHFSSREDFNTVVQLLHCANTLCSSSTN